MALISLLHSDSSRGALAISSGPALRITVLDSNTNISPQRLHNPMHPVPGVSPLAFWHNALSNGTAHRGHFRGAVIGTGSFAFKRFRRSAASMRLVLIKASWI
jgi:hypothetical protein